MSLSNLSVGDRSQLARHHEVDYGRLVHEWSLQRRAFVRTSQMYYRLAERYARANQAVRVRPQADESASLVRLEEQTSGSVRQVTITQGGPELPEIVSSARLTARQREVGLLIAEGLSNDEIARRLVITSGTVANHVRSILQRMGMRNRAQVAAWISKMAD